MNVNAETDSPSAASSWNVGDVFPLSSVWAGAPQGTPWNIPTAALQNAAGKFVAPSAAAAQASEADATLDPTTNLVTFNANANDAAAYNNYMMVESYLVVPTSGLTASKASALAQYIRFVTGPVAASDEETLGAAPPTHGDGGCRPEGGDGVGRRGCDLRRFVEHHDRQRQRRQQFDDIHDVDDDLHSGGIDGCHIGPDRRDRNRKHRQHRQRARLDGCAGRRSGARGGGCPAWGWASSGADDHAG